MNLNHRHQIVTLLVGMLLLPLNLFATGKQQSKESREQWAAAQAAKIAQELQLSYDATENFTRLYLECQREMWKTGTPRGPRNCSSKNIKTEQEAEKVLKARFEKRRKINAIQEKYYKKYSEILTQRQILKLYEVERRLMENNMKGKKSGKKSKSHSENLQCPVNLTVCLPAA